MIFIIRVVSADEVEFTASARTVVSVGDRFQLTYTANTRDGEFTGPDIKHFRMLSGPNISTSQSYQVIQGRMTQSVSVSYSYYLQAYEEGTFEIPAATLTIDGKEYASNVLSIEVIKGTAVNSQASQGVTQTPRGDDGIAKEDVFLRAYISNQNPYQGEQVIVTYQIYTAGIGISDIDFQNSTSFPGFWATNLMDPGQQITAEEATVNGKQYLTAVLYRGALFPQKSGEITIGAKKLNCTAQVRTEGNRKVRDPFFDSFFDDPFFNSRIKNVRIELESNPLKINVKPLPMAGKPSGFSGAVGNFQLESSVDNTSLKINDAITLKLVISGSGNLELINTPDINWPPDFETYEPKITKNIRTTASGVSGSRTFEYLAIPRSSGEFSLDPIELSFFDPATGKYQTLRTQAYTFSVEKGEQSASAVTYSGVAQEDIMYLGQDIRYLKRGPYDLSVKASYLFLSPLFFALLAIPVVLLMLLSIIMANNRKKKQNVALLKNRRATRIARKNLKKAKEFLQSRQREEFYAEVSRALWGYLSNKFNIPLSELSIDTVSERLGSKDISEESIEKFIGALNKCEFARFAPGDNTGLMSEVYDESISTISQIEGELK